MASKKRPVKASKKAPKKTQKPGVPLDSDETAVVDALALKAAGRAVKFQVDKLMHVIKAVDAGPDIQEARICAGGSNRGTNSGWVAIQWFSFRGAFGELAIRSSPSGKTEIRTECMGRDFAKAVLAKLVDDAEIVE